MKTKTVKNTTKRFGFATTSLVIPFATTLAILIVFIAYFSISLNQMTNDLTDFMQRFNQYQQSATMLQAGSSVLSETATIFIQTPQIPSESGTTTINAEPLKAYAAELTQDRRPNTIVVQFREYDVDDEILGYIETAANNSEEMQNLQTHALSLVFSVYPLPDDPVFSSITQISLTEEELAMPNEARLANAKKLLFEKNYSMLKANASKQIESCHRVLQKQFDNYCTESENRIFTLRIVLWSVIFLLIILIICAFLILYLWIVVPLHNYSKDIVSNRLLQKQGKIRELWSIATAYNGLMERRNNLEDYLRQAAEIDSLTGLQNRYNFDRVVHDLEQTEGSLGVLLFDVNYLKTVNDTKGHREGDRLLCQTANAIKECFEDESGGNCYRVGGDEFAAILRNCTKEEISERIEKFLLVLESKGISVAVGYAIDGRSDEQTFRRLLKEADERMYENKKYAHRKDEENN